jgi:hypothetical protein
VEAAREARVVTEVSGGGRRRSGNEGQMERVGRWWSRMGGEAAAPALALALAGGAAGGLRSE